MLSFTLMDFSEETLAYTKARIDEACALRGVQVPVTLVHESVHNLLKRASSDRGDRGDKGGAPELPFDFVYCAGLFDYLSDKVCMRLLQYFAARTRVDGNILVTNVHSANPQRNVMEHLLEWHLIYRDEADMRRLAPARTRVDELFTDSTGVNVFLTLTVQAQAG
jgi:extracellular factor (EF) 3-hydroxypalmitic acid methyl ester biosynthesis protein